MSHEKRPGQVRAHTHTHTRTFQPHFIEEACSPDRRTDSHDWKALKNSWLHHPTFQWGQSCVKYAIQPLTLRSKSDITSYRPLLKKCVTAVKAQVYLITLTMAPWESEPACSTTGPWNWSSRIQPSIIYYLHLHFSCCHMSSMKKAYISDTERNEAFISIISHTCVWQMWAQSPS